MKILSWNCRGLGGPSTISQLKESIRLYLPGLIFLCETKQKSSFIQTVCKQLKYGKRWDVVEPEGKNGGLWVAWNEDMQVTQIIKTTFCYELKVTEAVSNETFWVILVYASTDSKERQQQWDYLVRRKDSWGQKWVMGGDFNDIREHEEKEGGNRRLESSFWSFRSFIADLEMGEVKFRGEAFTWANNRGNEGFI